MAPRIRLSLSKPLPTIRETHEEAMEDSTSNAKRTSTAASPDSYSSDDYIQSICHLARPTFAGLPESSRKVQDRKTLKNLEDVWWSPSRGGMQQQTSKFFYEALLEGNMENITAPPGGDLPVAYPGTVLLPVLHDLLLAGGELGALGGLCHACAVAVLDLSCKNAGITLVPALSQPHQAARHGHPQFAVRGQEPCELALSPAGSTACQEQLWLRCSLGTLGWHSQDQNVK
uniref:Uncharacterized protein n=1 Tax=Falco tinnunculus TaxID=100819 RepID=A0A8C4UMW4_FALTI